MFCFSSDVIPVRLTYSYKQFISSIIFPKAHVNKNVVVLKKFNPTNNLFSFIFITATQSISIVTTIIVKSQSILTYYLSERTNLSSQSCHQNETSQITWWRMCKPCRIFLSVVLYKLSNTITSQYCINRFLLASATIITLWKFSCSDHTRKLKHKNFR